MGANNCRLLTASILEESFSVIDTVLFDCDGVLWRGSETIKGAIELTQTLLSNGKRVGYVTNNSSRTHEQMLAELQRRGFPIKDPDLVMCTARSTALYLADKKPNCVAFRVGNSAIAAELEKVGIKSWTSERDENFSNLKSENNLKVDAVICALDREFCYHRMAIAAHLLHTNKEALFLATNTDPTFPEAGGRLTPGCGSIVAAVQTAAGRTPDVIIGKPYALMFNQLQSKCGLDSKKTLMIGDRCDTDMGFASAIGAPSLFVQTGAETLEDAQRYTLPGASNPEFAPTFYLPSVYELDQLIKAFKNDRWGLNMY